jgi:signal transduction histidine kinase
MLDRLEEAYARERQFVADASHELRSPLTILRGELELVLRDAGELDGFREALTTAAEEAERLSQLAEDLLVISRSDQGRLPVTVERLNVRELLGSVSQRFSRRAAEHDIVVDAPPDLELPADRLRLEQAIGNLIDNALRHGGRPVELVARRAGQRVELHVLDGGPGFPPGFLDRAFERFTRGDAARQRGGAGLGLAIVQAIAVAHDGRAHARNMPEGGADVWLDVPVQPS